MLDRPEVRGIDLLDEAKRIVKAAKERGITLRMIGATAIRSHCSRSRFLLKLLERELSDIDLMGYGNQLKDADALFRDLNYTLETATLIYGGKRQIYHHKSYPIVVDFFFDELDMCHTIDFRGRLEKDYPTVSLADLLLEKMQIIRLTEKDIKDTIVLLREHEIGDKNEETINSGYISKLLSNDWGFYFTVKTNLEAIKNFLGKYSVLTEENVLNVKTKIDGLLERIEKEPKSFGWKIRAKVGARKKWYKEVEEPRERKGV